MKKVSTIFLLLSILLSCSSPKSSNESKLNNENAKQEIEKAEKDIAQMAADKGMGDGSWKYVWD